MNLQLSLKKEWFEMTKSGIKTEHYIEITPYWVKRLTQIKYTPIELALECLKQGKNSSLWYGNSEITSENYDFWFPKKFTTTTLTLGYPSKDKTERILKLEHKGIEIRNGNPEWGAEINKLYFVIKHGKIIN